MDKPISFADTALQACPFPACDTLRDEHPVDCSRNEASMVADVMMIVDGDLTAA